MPLYDLFGGVGGYYICLPFLTLEMFDEGRVRVREKSKTWSKGLKLEGRDFGQ